jgi:hypothetical protein
LLRTIDLGPVPGRPNPDTKAMTVISALLAGAEYIDDVDVLRSGASHAVWATASPRPQPWGRSSQASAGVMSASSTR